MRSPGRRSTVLLLSGSLLAAAGRSTAAPQSAPAPSPAPEEQQAVKTEGETARVTTTITVTAAPSPVKTEIGPDVRTFPANASIIDPGALERSSAREPAEVLRGLSGVDFTYYGQGGIPSGPSVRGYTDRNFGQDMAGFLDGIPLNLFGFVASHGAMDLTPLFTTSIERVELVRGPLDARYGDFHRGGSVNFVTRDGVARPSVTLVGGSFGTIRGALTYGNYRPGEARLSVYSNVEGYHAGGYADNQQVEHFKTFNKLHRPLGAGDLTLTLQGYWADWEAPSYLDRDLVQSGALAATAAVNPTDGGEQQNQLGSLRYRRGLDDPFSATAYVVKRDWKRWRSDFLLSPTQLQTQQVDERTSYGARVEKTFGRALLGRPSRFLVGAAGQRDDAATRQDATRQRVSVTRTDDVDELLTSFGVYAQKQLQAADWLKIMAGLRYSRVDYDIHDNIRAPGAFVATYDTDLWSPKVGAAVSLGRNIGLYANYATGMRSPTPRTEVRNSIGSVERVVIAKTESHEAGLTARLSTRLEVLAAVFRADNSNETRGIPPGGQQFESLGQSRREGAEGEISWFPISRTRIYAGVSWVDAVLTTPPAATPAATHLPDIPEYVHKIGFEAHTVRTGSWPGTVSVAADFAVHGPKDLNTLGTIRSARYERVTASLAYTTRDRYRVWLGGFAYPGSKIGESEFLFNTKVGVRPNPRVSVEGGITYTF